MKISVVTPVLDETDSVIDLCRGLLDQLGDDLLEILIIIAPHSSAASFDACLSISRAHRGIVKVVVQKGPRGIGIPYREGISYARGTHILCIDSDGEMELASAARLRDLFKSDPQLEVGVASRWAPGGGFSGYAPQKMILNWLFQRLFRVLYRTPIHDLTYGYKMFRTDLAQRLPFIGIRHEFACEGTLLPIRLGRRVGEVPSHWTRRRAGLSKNPFIDNFRYVAMAWRTLIRPPTLLSTAQRLDPAPLCRDGAPSP